MAAGSLEPVDCYEIWCDLAPGVNDLEFCVAVKNYLTPFIERGDMASYRIRRRKFGFGPEALGDFCLTLEFKDLASLDRVFSSVAQRDGLVEQFHHAVYSNVRNFKAALYRDFPDPVRQVPDELRPA
jgi:hypothetical protein